MSSFRESISLQTKMILNHMNISADSQIPQFQPEGSLKTPIKDLEATMRTSLGRNKSTSVEEITEDGEGSETKTDNLESVSSKRRGNSECVSLEKTHDLKSVVTDRIKSLTSTGREKKKNVTIRGPFFSVEKISKLLEPRVVSIGPVHRKLTNLKLMEDTKWTFLKVLSDYGNQIEVCIERIKNLEESARSCYQCSLDLPNDHKFAEILLLDSIFIIFLIFADAPKDNRSEKSVLSCVFDDLLKLQNQIPFSVVREMWDALFREEGVPYTDLETVLKRTKFWKDGLSHSSSDEICHLLDLYYKWNVPIPARVSNCQTPNWFLLGMPSWFSQAQTQAGDKKTTLSIQSATELYEAGVKFKPKAKFRNFLDISFENGILEIPTLELNSLIMSTLANLLLHEINNVEEWFVTSYVFFMDSLIKTKKDIALLEKFGVLNNKLASDDEAADSFNSLGEYIGILSVDTAENNFYTRVIQDITEYAASSWHRNWTSLKHKYFGSPWTGISVIAGSTLLILAFVQTYYAIFPRK